MVTLAPARTVYTTVEQPFNSMFFLASQFKDCAHLSGARRVLTYLGAFGADSVKPLEVWGNGSDQLEDAICRPKSLAAKRAT
eukprot:2146811-Pyramimonas_sp.AAC.1